MRASQKGRGEGTSAISSKLEAAIDQIAALRFRQAARILRSQVFQDSPEGQRLLALCYSEAGDAAEAALILRRLATKYREHPFVLADLGVAHLRSGNLRAAIRTLAQALETEPDDSDSAISLATALRFQGRAVQARAMFALLLKNHPADIRVLEGLYQSALEASDEESILPDLDGCIRSNRGSTHALGLAAEILVGHGNGLLACRYLRREGRMSDSAIGSLKLYFGLAHPSSSPKSQKKLIAEWVEKYLPAPTGERPRRTVSGRGEPLRVGYLTGEFTRGPAHYFVYPLIRYSDAKRITLHGYHSRARVDDRTRAVRRRCASFEAVSSWSDEQIADRIRRDRIDVLVDLSGHFDDNRLSVFRHRPAPVSFSYPNHPCTTGVPEIDYIITDRWIDPPGSPSKYIEQPWHLDHGYLSFTGIPNAPKLSELPAMRNGYITFGVLQQSMKLNDGVYDCFAGTLRAVPRSRLILRYSSGDLDNPRSAAVCRIREEFRSRGVDPARIELGGWLPREEYLALRDRFDIALDTFPFNGQTTTCDNLWMGIPTVSLVGQTHVARVGYSLLARVGLEDWVAKRAEEYVEIAARKASDRKGLSELRSTLRTTTRRQLNPRVVAQEVEQAYLTVSGRD